MTIDQSWIETSALKDRVHFSDMLDIKGPITIGMALSRKNNEANLPEAVIKEQRIVILGDGDFLSNTYLGNAGNLKMGLNIINWLSNDEQFINIPDRINNDIILILSPTTLSLMSGLFLLGIPILLILSGSIIWFRRRKH
jgi:ABC-type uncharacterized transport system involved in gliding motility auxiliary subunit